MKRAARTVFPERVTSLTCTTPRAVVTSTRRPAREAAISNVCEPPPVSTITSTRSPFMWQFSHAGRSDASRLGERLRQLLPAHLRAAVDARAGGALAQLVQRQVVQVLRRAPVRRPTRSPATAARRAARPPAAAVGAALAARPAAGRGIERCLERRHDVGRLLALRRFGHGHLLAARLLA